MISSPVKENTGSTRNLVKENDRDKDKGDNKDEDTESDGDTRDSSETLEDDQKHYRDNNQRSDKRQNSDFPNSQPYGDNQKEEEDMNGLKEIYSKHHSQQVHGSRKHSAPTKPRQQFEQHLHEEYEHPRVVLRGKKKRLSGHQRYSPSKHEWKSMINDDQAIDLKRKYGKDRVVLDFSKGNDEAKIIVYDEKHPSIEKRNRIHKTHQSHVHSLADSNDNNHFLNRLQKERKAYITSRKTSKTGHIPSMKDSKNTRRSSKQTHENSSKRARQNSKSTHTKTSMSLVKARLREVTSSKRGMMLTQHDKQESGLLSE